MVELFLFLKLLENYLWIKNNGNYEDENVDSIINNFNGDIN